MREQLAHTPYDGSNKPFSIGLRVLDPARWIDPDTDLDRYLDEKARLMAAHRQQVFLMEDGSQAGQRECLDLLVEHLIRDHADLYRREGNMLLFGNRRLALEDADTPPLLIAGSMVQDDLVILSRRDTGWHVVAGYVAFPSAWSLPEKIGKPMEQVHAPVPGFQAGTRNAALLNRIFDNLQPDMPAERFNWSVYPKGNLFWPPAVSDRHARAPLDAAGHIVRVERQTLRRLRKTGDVVFTIRIYIDPFAALLRHPDARRLATGLADWMEALSHDQLSYKGMAAKKAGLVAYVRGAVERLEVEAI